MTGDSSDEVLRLHRRAAEISAAAAGRAGRRRVRAVADAVVPLVDTAADWLYDTGAAVIRRAARRFGPTPPPPRDVRQVRARLAREAAEYDADRFSLIGMLVRYFETMPHHAWADRQIIAQEVVDLMFEPRPLADPRHTDRSARALLRLRGDVEPYRCTCGMRYCGWCMSQRADYVPAGYNGERSRR